MTDLYDKINNDVKKSGRYFMWALLIIAALIFFAISFGADAHPVNCIQTCNPSGTICTVQCF